ncbi:MAG: exosortase-associated EpsI family protein [Chloroherpetonaceae bacterium]|nr:EpsI family protein [Chthonomonadaceae bacterium]MDW8207678.1 exosortase-associated EpsI family protein [Chloroherpetonaceae bacterium]
MQSHFRRDYALIALLVAGILANFGAMSLARGRKFVIPPPLPLPEQILGFKGTTIPTDKTTQSILPHARIMQMVYERPGAPVTDVAVIASRDPNDMHTPERCFLGSGFEILRTDTREIRVDGPNPGAWTFNRVIIRSPDRQDMVLYGYDGVRMLGGSTLMARIVMKFSGPTAKPAYFIRVAAPITADPAATEEHLTEFLKALMRARTSWQTAG